jgi:hypothetical protein
LPRAARRAASRLRCLADWITRRTISVGLGAGRIKDLAISDGEIAAVTLDLAVTQEAGKSYALQVRSAARRNETAKYTLTMGITGSADAKVAGTPYHATGEVPCSVGADPNQRVTAEKQGDEWSIGINSFYYYVIPEAVIVGG